MQPLQWRDFLFQRNQLTAAQFRGFTMSTYEAPESRSAAKTCAAKRDARDSSASESPDEDGHGPPTGKGTQWDGIALRFF